ncbi:MAG: pilus assembly protein TadG-related protein [Solirubrobacteraceae bacterium]
MRKFGSGESGQSLVIIAIAMVVVLGISALAIDVASWHVKRHEAQVAADAAALAAANCLANAAPGYECTSTADTADATSVATTIAQDNGVTIPASAVTYSGGTVYVAAPNPAPALFANLFGIHTTVQTADAGASWTPPVANPCTSAGPTCDFMFAANNNCSGSGSAINLTINLSVSGNTTVQGVIQTNGNLGAKTNGNVSLGSATYGPGNCSSTTSSKGHNPWSTPPTQATSDSAYPVNYAQDFPACGGTGDPCAASGYPSFCSKTGANFNNLTPSSQNIYCASGTGTTSDPSTWNGTISLTANGSNTWYDSFVAGSISYNLDGNDTLSACGYVLSGYNANDCSSAVPAPATTNYPIFYAVGTSSTALSITLGGGEVLNGDMYAPNGTAQLSLNGNKTLNTFIESDEITATISGDFNGDGPQSYGGGGGTPGTDSLTQ